MRPQTRFRSDSAGLCGRLCRPSPRRSQELTPFALRLVEVGAPICSWDFLGGQFVNRPTGFGVFSDERSSPLRIDYKIHRLMTDF